MALEELTGWTGIFDHQFDANHGRTTVYSEDKKFSFHVLFSLKNFSYYGECCSEDDNIARYIKIGDAIHFDAHCLNRPNYDFGDNVWYEASAAWVGKLRPAYETEPEDDYEENEYGVDDDYEESEYVVDDDYEESEYVVDYDENEYVVDYDYDENEYGVDYDYDENEYGVDDDYDENEYGVDDDYDDNEYGVDDDYDENEYVDDYDENEYGDDYDENEYVVDYDYDENEYGVDYDYDENEYGVDDDYDENEYGVDDDYDDNEYGVDDDYDENEYVDDYDENEYGDDYDENEYGVDDDYDESEYVDDNESEYETELEDFDEPDVYCKSGTVIRIVNHTVAIMRSEIGEEISTLVALERCRLYVNGQKCSVLKEAVAVGDTLLYEGFRLPKKHASSGVEYRVGLAWIGNRPDLDLRRPVHILNL